MKGDPRINKKGGPKLPPEYKELRNMTAVEFVTTFNMLFRKTHAEIYVIANDPKTPIIQSYLCKCLLAGKLRGDFYTYNLMMDRLIGRVKETVVFDGSIDTTHTEKTINGLSEKATKMLAKAIVQAKAKLGR